MIDRDRLREALDIVNNGSRPEDLDLWPYQVTPLMVIEEAARLVADPDTLVVEKVNGEWPFWAYQAMDDAEKAVYSKGADMVPLANYLDALLAYQTGDTE